MIGIAPWPSDTPPFVGKGLFAWVGTWSLWLSNLTSQVNASAAAVRQGTGSPEAVVVAAQGSIFLRQDGGANTTLYVKTTGGATPNTLTNTGWVAVTIP
jgi:hypothetical protein